MNGSLLNDPWFFYRAEPSSEVDGAWERIALVKYFPIKEESLKRLGKESKHAVRIPTSWGLSTRIEESEGLLLTVNCIGYPEGLYVAQNDGQHLLHCLNVIRKFSYWEYYHHPSR
jgi:hypothetical protein